MLNITNRTIKNKMEQNNKQRKLLDYSNGKIYKIVNDTNDKIYIGSTTSTLAKRLSEHKKIKRANDKQRPFYKDLFDNIGKEHFSILLIEEFPCNSRLELERREYEIIQQHVQELGRDKIYNLRCAHNDYSDECKKKISEANKKENKPISEEQKKAISDRTKGEYNPMYNKRREKAPAFKRGCIRYDKIKNRWCYDWITYHENDVKKRYTKSFSISIWGEEGAKEHCEKIQNEIYPL